jgi:hypothetical protein
MDGTFWVIFMLLIPIANLIASYRHYEHKKLALLGLSFLGIGFSIFTQFKIYDLSYGVTNGGAVMVIFNVGYTLLFIIAMMIIVASYKNIDQVSNIVKTALNSESLKRGIDTAHQLADSAIEKAKNVVSDLSNSDLKKTNSVAEQLKTYKDLLDQGVISQEDYEKKKNDILHEKTTI